MVETGKITILNVDDNESGLYTKSRILRRAHYRVLEAQTGHEALRLVQEARPQLVLLDVKLPDMHGFEVCRRIKAMPSTAQTLVLHISAAYIDKATHLRALEGGADAYISEPVEAEELLANVNALLRLWRAESTIRESEERWALAVRATDDAIWDCDLVTGKLWWNEAYRQRFDEWPVTEPLSWQWRNDHIHPADRTRVVNSFDAALRGSGITWREEYRYQRLDGAYAEILDRVSITRNAQGVATRILGAILDLSERKQHERQLRYYASLQENVNDAVIVTDPDLCIRSWNRAAETIYGWKAEEAIGRTVTEVLQTQYSLGELTEHQLSVLFQQGWWQGEVVQRCKDDRQIHVLGSITALKDEHSLVYGLVAINRDITQQKHAHEALRASEARYRLLADNVSDWVTRINPRREYLYVSPSTQAVLGYEPEELLNQSEFRFVHPDDKAMFQEKRQDALERRLVSPILTYRRRHKDGYYIWLETKSSAIWSTETGEVLELVTSSRDITERKRAEEALRTKIDEERTFQQHLKTLHEITIELTAIDQLDDFYKQVVKLGLERLGFERLGLLFYDAEHGLALGTYGTDAQGRLVAEQHIRLDPASLTSILQRALASPEHFIFDAQTQLFDNFEAIGIGWNAVAVLRNGQQSLGWLTADNGVHQRPASKPLLDILALYSLTIGTLLGRKQLETALRKSEEKFRLLVEAAPLAIIISDQAGRITLVNHHAELLFGYARSELLGQLIDFLVPDAARARHPGNRATYIGTRQARQMGIGQELYARRQDGHEFPVEIELSHVETPSGLLVMSFILDISERKQAAEALRSQRDFLQLVIDSVPDLITVKDRAGRFQLANERIAQIYGRTSAAMIGQTDASLNPNLEEVNFIRQKDQEVLDSGQPVFIPEQSLLGRYYQTSKLPLPHVTEQPEHLLVVASDITERKQAEQALQQALEKEKELSELKSRFVSMASHEFRTPLMSILAVTETLHAYRHKLTDTEIVERLENIREQVSYLKKMMENVLQLTRIQAHRVELEPDWLDLAAFCQSVIDEFQSRPDVQHRLVFYNASGECTTELDKRLMRQIISNLLSNAIKYSPEDKPVMVSLQSTSSMLILKVCDQGIGIPTADLKYLFQPFHRATNVGVITGTGLGLTIAKEAVERHGGTITVESQIGLGTTFTINIPRHYSYNDQGRES